MEPEEVEATETPAMDSEATEETTEEVVTPAAEEATEGATM
jgi:hypothetical protein